MVVSWVGADRRMARATDQLCGQDDIHGVFRGTCRATTATSVGSCLTKQEAYTLLRTFPPLQLRGAFVEIPWLLRISRFSIFVANTFPKEQVQS